MRILLWVLFLPFLILGRILLRGNRKDMAYLPEGHPDMAKAVGEARASLHDFRQLVTAPESGMANFALKIRFPVEGGSEHIWVDHLEVKGSGFVGKLANHPNQIQGMILGSTVEISEDIVTDWAYSKDGIYHGHFTTKVLLPRMHKKMRAQVEQAFGWNRAETT